MAAALAVCAMAATGALARPAAHTSPDRARTIPALSRLHFERNDGQTDARVRYLAHGPGYTLFLTRNAAILDLDHLSQPGSPTRKTSESVLRLKLVGASPAVKVKGEQAQAAKVNYFLGRNPKNWHTDVPTFGRVEYEGAYPGIDVVYYGSQGQLEYDVRVAPGARLRQVRLKIEGAESITKGRDGALELKTEAGIVTLSRPNAYEMVAGKKRRVEVSYARVGKDEYGLVAAEYARNAPLVIDPVLSYSTYLGGNNGDIAYGVAVDGSGDIYVAGSTASLNFPVSSPEQKTLQGSENAFVAKLNPTGSALVYSTYVGGNGVDSARAIALDSSGNAYVTGTTTSANFPVTSGVFQPAYHGSVSNAFVFKLSSTGSSLAYATYLGGSDADYGQAIAVDAKGDAFVAGSTQSPDFPTENPIQSANKGCATNSTTSVTTCTSDAFVAELNPTATSLVYSTYLGGSSSDSGQAVALDSQGDCYVAGYTSSIDFPVHNALQTTLSGTTDAFVTELNPSGNAVLFSTYLGGGTITQAYGLALDAADNIYVTGETQSADYHTTSGAAQTTYGGNGDAFVTKLSAGGAAIAYSTFLGGNQPDQGNAIAVDAAGDAAVAGFTQSADFPTVDPMQSTLGISGAGTCGSGTCPDAFVVKLNPSGAVTYSTFLGGSGADYAQAVALDASGSAIVAGSTSSGNFPATSGAVQGANGAATTSTNGFIAKVGPADAPGLAMAPQAVNFGNQTVSQKSAPQSVMLVDEGSAPLTISQVSATGDYQETGNCAGTTLSAGGGTCTINITFTPQTAAASTGNVTITDNAAGSPQSVALTGTGTTASAGALTLTPTSITFPGQTVGTTSAGQAVVITNSGQSSVSVTGISVSGQFSQTNSCGALPVTLNAGASCTVTILFQPTSGGSQSGTLTVTNSGSANPTASLTGTGAAEFSLSSSNTSTSVVVGTATASFTVAAAAPSSFTGSIALSCSSTVTCSFNPASIKPGQSSALTVTGLSSLSSNPTDFTVTGTSGSGTSAETATLALSVAFSDFSLSATPPLNSISAGDSATYTVTLASVNGLTGTVNLSCAAGLPAGAACTWSPSSVTLNGTNTPTASVTITTTSQHKTSGIVVWPGAGRGPGSGHMGEIAGAGLVLLLLAFAMLKKRKLGLGRTMAILLLGATLLLTLSSVTCNDQYYGFIGSSPAPIGTPSGVYTVTVAGTLSTNASVARSASVNLAVGPTP